MFALQTNLWCVWIRLLEGLGETACVCLKKLAHVGRSNTGVSCNPYARLQISLSTNFGIADNIIMSTKTYDRQGRRHSKRLAKKQSV